ncbi:hypothetical protein F5B20DRAFT_563710 [Whalleya microplaca]|nr:hypothetical protein F5B20DRAFT_563710 [Whalleya microplaca]
MPEILVHSRSLLPSALQILGSTDVIEHAENKRVIISKFPKGDSIEPGINRKWSSFEGEHVTGLGGRATVKAQGFYQDGNEKKRVNISPGDYWEIRWDYDPEKGSHVNVKVGEHRFAVLYPEGDFRRNPQTAPNLYFDAIRDQDSFVGYRKGINEELAYYADQLARYYCARFRAFGL